MDDLLRLLLIPVIIGGAWLLSGRYEEVTRKIAQFFGIGLFVLLSIFFVTGWLSGGSTIHEWTGHIFVIALWIGVFFSIGVIVRRNRQQPIVIIGQTIALLTLLGIGILESLVGYLVLHPTGSISGSEETVNRFTIWHLYLLPMLIAVLIVMWIWFFRPKTFSTTTCLANNE